MDWLLSTWVFTNIIRPALDIGLLAFLLYRGYRILFQTRAMQLIQGAVVMVLIYLLALGLRLGTLTWILNFLAPGIVVGLAIVFQPELRKIFTQIGQGSWFSPRSRTQYQQVESVLTAAEMLSGMHRGALVVFMRRVGLKNIIERGTTLNSTISSALILTIFAHDTPLHDGGVIIQGNTLLSAGCFFPISEQVNIRKSFGTRHRAALGLAEESDAVILVVSEETGAISLAYDGMLHYNLDLAEVRRRLKVLLNYRESTEEVSLATEGGES